MQLSGVELDRIIPASNLRFILNWRLVPAIQQLFVQDGQVKLVLADGRRLRFTAEETGIRKSHLQTLTNQETIRFVVSRLIDWRKREGARATMHELRKGSVHVLATQQVLDLVQNP